jgi:hypothetical protein
MLRLYAGPPAPSGPFPDLVLLVSVSEQAVVVDVTPRAWPCTSKSLISLRLRAQPPNLKSGGLAILITSD